MHKTTVSIRASQPSSFLHTTSVHTLCYVILHRSTLLGGSVRSYYYKCIFNSLSSLNGSTLIGFVTCCVALLPRETLQMHEYVYHIHMGVTDELCSRPKARRVLFSVSTIVGIYSDIERDKKKKKKLAALLAAMTREFAWPAAHASPIAAYE